MRISIDGDEPKMVNEHFAYARLEAGEPVGWSGAHGASSESEYIQLNQFRFSPTMQSVEGGGVSDASLHEMP